MFMIPNIFSCLNYRLFIFPTKFYLNYNFQKLVMNNGGESYEMWRKPQVQLYLKVYIFNITNHEAFLAGREKLRFQEVGPYVYRYVDSVLSSSK